MLRINIAPRSCNIVYHTAEQLKVILSIVDSCHDLYCEEYHDEATDNIRVYGDPANLYRLIYKLTVGYDIELT